MLELLFVSCCIVIAGVVVVILHNEDEFGELAKKLF